MEMSSVEFISVWKTLFMTKSYRFSEAGKDGRVIMEFRYNDVVAMW